MKTLLSGSKRTTACTRACSNVQTLPPRNGRRRSIDAALPRVRAQWNGRIATDRAEKGRCRVIVLFATMMSRLSRDTRHPDGESIRGREIYVKDDLLRVAFLMQKGESWSIWWVSD